MKALWYLVGCQWKNSVQKSGGKMLLWLLFCGVLCAGAWTMFTLIKQTPTPTDTTTVHHISPRTHQPYTVAQERARQATLRSLERETATMAAKQARRNARVAFLPQLETFTTRLFFLLIPLMLLGKAFVEPGIVFGAKDRDFLLPSPIDHRYLLLRSMVGNSSAFLFPFLMFTSAAVVRLLKGKSIDHLLLGAAGLLLLIVSAINVATAIRQSRTGTDDERVLSRRSAVGKAWWYGIGVSVIASIATMFALLVRRGESGFDSDFLGTFFHLVNGPVVGYSPVGWVATLFQSAPEGHGSLAHNAQPLCNLALTCAASFGVLYAHPMRFYDESALPADALLAPQQSDTVAPDTRHKAHGLRRLFKNGSPPELGTGAWAIVWRNLATTVNAPKQKLYTLFMMLVLLLIFTVVSSITFKGMTHETNGFPPPLILLAAMPFLFLMMGGVATGTSLKKVDTTKLLPIAPHPFVIAELGTMFPLPILLVEVGLLLIGLVNPDARAWVPAALWAAPAQILLTIILSSTPLLAFPDNQNKVHLLLGGLSYFGLFVASFLPAAFLGSMALWLHEPLWITGVLVCVVDGVLAWYASRYLAHLWANYDPTA